MPPTRVFLSCARGDDPPDRPFVRRLHADLTVAGFTVWFDRETLMSRGLTLHQEIKDYDRNAVRQFPAILAAAGLEVQRGL